MKLKQILILVIILIGQKGFSQRQVFIDVFAGLNHSYIESCKRSNGLAYGMNYGLLLNVSHLRNNEFRFGVLYNEKGFEIGKGVNDQNLKLKYITIPVYYNLSVNTSGTFKMYLGPEFNILLSKSASTLDLGLEKEVENGDVSIGMGFKLKASRNVFYSVGISLHYIEPFNDFNILNFPLSIGITI